jgi:hypothetical protein
MARIEDKILLEPCGSYKSAGIRARVWARAVCKLGIQSQYGVKIGQVPGAGWSVFLARHDGGRITAPKRLTVRI